MKKASNLTTTTESYLLREVLGKRVDAVIHLWASWSGTCAILLPVLEDVAAEYSHHVKFYSAEVDEQSLIVQGLGLRRIPVTLLVGQGELADYFCGALPRQEVENRVLALQNSALKTYIKLNQKQS